MAKATTFTEVLGQMVSPVAIWWVPFTATTLLAEAAGGADCDEGGEHLRMNCLHPQGGQCVGLYVGCYYRLFCSRFCSLTLFDDALLCSGKLGPP